MLETNTIVPKVLLDPSIEQRIMVEDWLQEVGRTRWLLREIVQRGEKRDLRESLLLIGHDGVSEGEDAGCWWMLVDVGVEGVEGGQEIGEEEVTLE